MKTQAQEVLDKRSIVTIQERSSVKDSLWQIWFYDVI